MTNGDNRPTDGGPAGTDLARPTRVTLTRTESEQTDDQLLWAVIKDRSDAITFENYKVFMDQVEVDGGLFRGVEGYQTLKNATRAWLQHEAGVWLSPVVERNKNGRIESTNVPDPVAAEFERSFRSNDAAPKKSKPELSDIQHMRDTYLAKLENDLRVLPYHKLIIDSLGALPIKDRSVVFGDYGISPAQLFRPVLLELIWSYWHEEGMLVQTMNAISRRFQNRSTTDTGHDPLARLEIDPLRTVNNLVWGYVQDEWNLLTVQRRAYEYQHEYGISLLGRAIPGFDPADSRSRFLASFHDLLATCAVFFEADDDTTVIADAFPVLNALKDVHPILAEGAHNQFGDMAWTARSEMLAQQWILSRPEFREFLGGRAMVPYREPWMDRVDTMKQLQGWGDASVTHFRDLAVFGEQLLLSIRYGNWSVINDSASAANWAREWRTEVQTYMHSYRAVTGVDVGARDARSEGRDVAPSVHLRRRLEERRRRTPALPAGAAPARGGVMTKAAATRPLGA